jgi:hypothetical protein
MVTFLKCFLGLFILFGIGVSIYGGLDLASMAFFARNNTERARGVFLGYAREYVASSSTSSSPNDWSRLDTAETTSFMSYPEFEFETGGGGKVRAVGRKQHIIEWFKPGRQIEVIVSKYGDHEMADFYSLYSWSICVLAVGLCFILIPALIWSVVIPGLKTTAGLEVVSRFNAMFGVIMDTEVGPFRVVTLLKATGAFIVAVTIFGLATELVPYIKHLRLGGGYALIESIEKGSFDEARKLILGKKGINTVNEYGQSPLLLALEAGRFDLAQLLIDAGAKVNVKSKMYMTPLRVAATAGDLETVRMLLARGASADAPDDETPPAIWAMIKGHDEVARLIIESGCDLKRKYIMEDGSYTIGDMTIMARKPALTDAVRRRGGSFTIAQ